MQEANNNYTYTTVTRVEGEPAYTYAEIKYGKIIAIHKHWIALDEFRKFFEPDCFFIDITGVTIENEQPMIGDVVVFNDHGYEIKHYKTTYNFADTKVYKISQLKLERNKKEVKPIEYNNHKYDCDPTSLLRLELAKHELEDNKGIIISKLWTTSSNEDIELTLADFNNILNNISKRNSELHNRYNQLKDYINNATDEKYISVVLNIDWNTDTTQSLETYYLAELNNKE